MSGLEPEVGAHPLRHGHRSRLAWLVSNQQPSGSEPGALPLSYRPKIRGRWTWHSMSPRSARPESNRASHNHCYAASTPLVE